MTPVNDMEPSPLFRVEQTEHLVGRERCAAEFKFTSIQRGIDGLQLSREERGKSGSAGGMIGLGGWDDEGWSLHSRWKITKPEERDLRHRLPQSGAIFAGTPLCQPIIKTRATAAIGEDEMFHDLTGIPTRSLASWMSFEIVGRQVTNFRCQIGREFFEGSVHRSKGLRAGQLRLAGRC